MNTTKDRIIREAERRVKTGLSRSQWFRLEREGVCPRRRKIGKSAVRWLESELGNWINSRIPGLKTGGSK